MPRRTSSRLCSIIILNWNSRALLGRCLDLVRKHNSTPYEIVVVDNGSDKDNSVEYIRHILDCRKIYNRKNVGFAAGVNQAIKTTKGSDVCLLNVDAEVQEGWLDELYATMEKIPSCGIVGPLGNEIENGYQKEGSISADTVVANVHGFCMLISRELIDKIGLFDERFSPGGCEDMDYCMRARLAHHAVAISAGSLVRHKAHQVYEINGIDGNTRRSIDAANERKYLEKYFGMLLEYGKAHDYFGNKELSLKTGLVIS